MPISCGTPVRGWERDLARLVRNLTDNAVEHAARLVEIGLVAEDHMAVVTIADDGPGVSESDRARVFERFTRLESHRARSASGGGTGLGLAISREIAEAQGGTLAVSGKDAGNTGAVFTLRLPLDRGTGSPSTEGKRLDNRAFMQRWSGPF